MALKERRPILIERTLNRFDPVGMAEQARWLNRPIEVIIQILITRR
jgi:hypothetical protein